MASTTPPPYPVSAGSGTSAFYTPKLPVIPHPHIHDSFILIQPPPHQPPPHQPPPHRRQLTAVMETMRPPPTDRRYTTLSELIDAVNEHAGAEGYAVVKVRTKTSKKEVVRKCVLKCDREDDSKDNHATDKRFDSSRLIDCQFAATALLIDDE